MVWPCSVSEAVCRTDVGMEAAKVPEMGQATVTNVSPIHSPNPELRLFRLLLRALARLAVVVMSAQAQRVMMVCRTAMSTELTVVDPAPHVCVVCCRGDEHIIDCGGSCPACMCCVLPGG